MPEDSAVLVDRSGREAVEYRPLKPIIVRRQEIEEEIERLAAIPFFGSRRVSVVHPGLTNGGFNPACTFTINVLLPSERTRPHRHNSSVINFCARGTGSSIIGGRTIQWAKYDTWTTPPWAIHQHINDSNELNVRFSYSNSGLLSLLGVSVFEEAEGMDPNQPLGDPQEERDKSARGETIGDHEAALLSYEHLISPEPPYQTALYWPWSEVHSRLQDLTSLGPEYKGRRLFILYDRNTERTQGTTATFFAALTVRPGGIVDEPHRHTSAAINYFFGGKGWSIVGGERYEWEAGDLMLAAPGWMPHGHASYPGDDVYELTIQDSPLQIAVGSLLWMENLREGKTEALGVTKGFETNIEALKTRS